MKKVFLLSAFLGIFIAHSAFALSVKLTRTLDSGDISINSSLDNYISTLNTQFNNELDKFGSEINFVTAIGNTLAYTYNTGTFTGFQDYDLFAASVGGTGYLATGDTFGAGAAIAGNIGIRANWLLDFFDVKDKNRFYLNLKFGLVPLLPELKRKFDDTEVQFDSTLIGLGANYSIIHSKELTLLGLDIVKWKGISLGTGLYYTSENLTITQFVNQSTASGTGFDVYYKGDVPFVIKSSNITIPIEALTAIQVLIFNISAGAGIDFNIGSTDISSVPKESIRSSQDIALTSILAGDPIGKVEINIDKGNSSIVRLKLLAGAGILLGPVKIEVPFYYYPTADYGVGLNAGIVW